MITDEQVIELLTPHKSALRRIHDEALEELNKAMNAMNVKMNKRAKPTLLNNSIVERAKTYFRDVPEVELIDKWDTLALNFGDRLLCRFKKLKKNALVSSNAETRRNTRIIQGTLFPREEPHALVEFCYLISDTWDKYIRLIAVKRQNKIGISLFEIESQNIDDLATIKANEVKPQSEDNNERDENQLRYKNG
jgi:hypothetical protein